MELEASSSVVHINGRADQSTDDVRSMWHGTDGMMTLYNLCIVHFLPSNHVPLNQCGDDTYMCHVRTSIISATLARRVSVTLGLTCVSHVFW
jgi:hypothetical protein